MITGGDGPAHEMVSFMIRTNELEMRETEGAFFLDCFKGTEICRTVTVCLMFVYQNFSGNQHGKQAISSSSSRIDFKRLIGVR